MKNNGKEIVLEKYKTINDALLNLYGNVERKSDEEESLLYYNYYPRKKDYVVKTVEEYHSLDWENSTISIRQEDELLYNYKVLELEKINDLKIS